MFAQLRALKHVMKRVSALFVSRPLSRDHVRTRGTRHDRLSYHQAALHVKRAVVEERRRLGAIYLARHVEDDPGIVIDTKTGIGVADLSARDDVRAAVAECRRMIAEGEANDTSSKGSLVFLASSKKDFGDESAVTALAFSPTLLIPIIRYFGMLPILFGFDINRAQAHELIKSSSHMAHLDPEDVTQIKVFVYLVDVDEETRPFSAIPADLSDRVVKALRYRTERLSDEDIASVIGPNRNQVFLGPVGSTVFCDTNRCLHYGGRPGRNVRDVLTLYYMLPTSTWLPLNARDGERRNLTPRLTSVPGNDMHAALLGHDLVY